MDSDEVNYTVLPFLEDYLFSSAPIARPIKYPKSHRGLQSFCVLELSETQPNEREAWKELILSEILDDSDDSISTEDE